jgi:tetratricopeptide (TPR) repeat protein
MMPFALTKTDRSEVARRILALLIALSGSCVWSQSGAPVQSEPDQTWAGQRIVTLQGFGDYFALGANGKPRLVNPEGLGVNIVAVVAKVEADRIWIRANGAGNEPVGWVNKGDAILLDNAVPYFTSRIESSPKDWDAYLRRAESEHSLNQRDAAIADYTRAIELHPNEPFLFLRRGREYRIVAAKAPDAASRACSQAVGDFQEAARLNPQWAEAYEQAAGVYADCPDPAGLDPEKAIVLIERAFALSPNPTYLTVLARAFFRSGNLERAVTTQRQALKSPRFPPGYREEALQQLHGYESALAAKKR